MKRIFYPTLLLLFLVACSGKTTTDTGESVSSGGGTLNLNAAPRQGFTPLRVTFRAELTGVNENSEDWYCLQEEWDFGDGAKSTEKPNCDPYSPDAKIKTEFFADHVYEKQGNYSVRLVLGDEKLRSRATSVNVVERDRGYN